VLLLLVAFLAGMAVAAARATPRPPHFKLWLCVHRQERTGWHYAGTYLGGLQLGGWFVAHYGRLVAHPPGSPHTWAPLDQMWFAERAYAYERYSRDWLWGQWPPSRGVCF
jgi:hypothetical protein